LYYRTSRDIYIDFMEKYMQAAHIVSAWYRRKILDPFAVCNRMPSAAVCVSTMSVCSPRFVDGCRPHMLLPDRHLIGVIPAQPVTKRNVFVRFLLNFLFSLTFS